MKLDYFIAKKTNIEELIKFLLLIILVIYNYKIHLENSNGIAEYLILNAASTVLVFYEGYNFAKSIRPSIWLLAIITIGMEFYFFEEWRINLFGAIVLGELYLVFAYKMIEKSEVVFFIHFMFMMCLIPITYQTAFEIGMMMVGYLHKRGKKETGYLMLAIILSTLQHQYWIYVDFLNDRAPKALNETLILLSANILAYCVLRYAKHDKILHFLVPTIFQWMARNIIYIYFITFVIFFRWMIFCKGCCLLH